MSIRRKFAALAAGALLSAAAALPSTASAVNQYDTGLWTLDPTPYTFLTQMHADGAPFWIRFALTNPNGNAHSGGFRAMKCDGTTAIGDYADFGISDGSWHYLARNVITGTCWRARGYTKGGFTQRVYVHFES